LVQMTFGASVAVKSPKLPLGMHRIPLKRTFGVVARDANNQCNWQSIQGRPININARVTLHEQLSGRAEWVLGVLGGNARQTRLRSPFFAGDILECSAIRRHNYSRQPAMLFSEVGASII
jgi:hypothetical protein